MKILLNGFLLSLSKALDIVESQLIGTDELHAERVAVITYHMMKRAGADEEYSLAASMAALLHDCALKEYLDDEISGSLDEKDMKKHCAIGERLAGKLPGYSLVKDAILYHHERADGSGAFGKKASETPLHSQVIHLADQADVYADLYVYGEDKEDKLREYIKDNTEAAFSEDTASLFLDILDDEFVSKLSGMNVSDMLSEVFTEKMEDVSLESIKDMSEIFADIADYKSHFTWRHSLGIAEKAMDMGAFLGRSEEECIKLYIAGLLHDIGKILIPEEILEKPGKLDPDEYREIQNHATGTWNLLRDVKGFEEITRIAALHHEKLDGSGYPFGYTEKDLSMDERLLACLDIYQALSEERPYKEGLNHRDSMAILKRMGESGQLDNDLILKIDECFKTGEEHHEEMNHFYTRDDDAAKNSGVHGWRCPVCGFIHEGDLPDDFICPRCEQPASVFERI